MGDQGNTYNIVGFNNEEETFKPGPSGEMNMVVVLGFISKGSAPNFLTQCTMHITVPSNGSGTPSVDRSNCTTKCAG